MNNERTAHFHFQMNMTMNEKFNADGLIEIIFIIVNNNFRRLSEFVTNYCHVLGTFKPVLCGKATQNCFFVVDVGLANLMALAGNGTSTRRFEVRICRL